MQTQTDHETRADGETDAAFVERMEKRYILSAGPCGGPGCVFRSNSIYRLIALARLAVTQPAAAPDAGGNQEDEDGPHRTHVLRSSDASPPYDLVCVNCGVHDIPGCGWGDLGKPCKNVLPPPPGASAPPVAPAPGADGIEAMRDAVKKEVLRYADYYLPHSDERNTFTMLAGRVDEIAAALRAGSEGGK